MIDNRSQYANKEYLTSGLYFWFLLVFLSRSHNGDFQNFLVENQHFFALYLKKFSVSCGHFDANIMVISGPTSAKSIKNVSKIKVEKVPQVICTKFSNK